VNLYSKYCVLPVSTVCTEHPEHLKPLDMITLITLCEEYNMTNVNEEMRSKEKEGQK
jgi:hypothetical protein